MNYEQRRRENRSRSYDTGCGMRVLISEKKMAEFYKKSGKYEDDPRAANEDPNLGRIEFEKHKSRLGRINSSLNSDAYFKGSLG